MSSYGTSPANDPEGAEAHIRSPLAQFCGAEPVAPAWFSRALAHEPKRGWVESRGTKLELLTWGKIGSPGVLLAHGNGAQADWWTFIAPFLADDFRVAAFSMAGMGRSEWRDSYAFGHFEGDVETVVQAAGLYRGGLKPIYIGHSLGGTQVFHLAAHHPEKMRACILVDAGFRVLTPEVVSEHMRRVGKGQKHAGTKSAPRTYATLADALARFRLMPPQPAGNLYIADFIARQSLKPVAGQNSEGKGWIWRSDPEIWAKFDLAAAPPWEYGPGITVPLAHIYGEMSVVQMEAAKPLPLPPHAIEIEIPDAHHHVLVDQPLALITAIRALLASWRD